MSNIAKETEEQIRKFQDNLRRQMRLEYFNRVRKPLIDKWEKLSESDKQFTRQWLKNRRVPHIDRLEPDALQRGYEYITSLKPSKNLKSDGTPQQKYDNSTGDKVFQMKHNIQAPQFLLSYMLTGVKPDLKHTSFIEAASEGFVEGAKMLTKVALDPVGLAIDVGEGVADKGLSFEALDKAEEDIKDYDIKDIATDVAINVATAGLLKVAAPAAKGVAKAVAKAVKKVAPKTGKAIETVVKKATKKATKKTIVPQVATREAEKEAEQKIIKSNLADVEKQLEQSKASLILESQLSAIESNSIYDKKYIDALEDMEKQIAQLEKNKILIRKQYADTLDEVEKKFLYEEGMTLGSGEIGAKHRKVFKFIELGYEKPNEREAIFNDFKEMGSPDYDFKGWRYDTSLSNEERAIFVNDELKTVHINNRGTQTSEDWDTNKKYLFGLKEKRYDRLVYAYESAHLRYGDYVIEGSGQSLGGAETQAIVDKFGTKDWLGEHTAVNPLTSPLLRARFTANALALGDESEKLASKLTTIAHSSDLPHNIGGSPYGQTITYDIPLDENKSWIKEAHKMSTLEDGEGVIKTIKYVSPNAIRKELTEDFIENLKYSPISITKPIDKIISTIADVDESDTTPTPKTSSVPSETTKTDIEETENGGVIEDVAITASSAGVGDLSSEQFTETGTIESVGFSVSSAGSSSLVGDSPHLETSDYKIKEIETVHNVDELIVKTLNLCELAYEPETGIEEGYYFLDSDQDVLFHKRESRMYIAFRGMLDGSVNFLVDEVGTESSQMLADYDLFDEILNGDRSELQAHAGIIDYVERKYYAIRQELRTFYHSIESVILCGDGIGGASAELFYYIYANDIRQARKVKVEKCVSYGAPRFILTPELYYTDKTEDLLRIYNKEDVIPFILLNRPVDDSVIPDGFQHVGTQMCLDGAETDHSANRFIARIIRSSSEIVSALFDVQAFAFIMSPSYQVIIMNCLIESMKSAKMGVGLTELQMKGLVGGVKRRIEEADTYEDKCEELRAFGIADYMLTQQPRDEEENIFLSLALACIVPVINPLPLTRETLNVSASSIGRYREDVEILIVREIEERLDITQDVETQIKAEFDPDQVADIIMSEIE